MVETYYVIGKQHLRHNAGIHLLICCMMLLLSPLILGIRNLDAQQSAKVLETYVALIGIVLFPPLFLPEQDKDLRDLIASKYTSIAWSYLVRIALGLMMAMVLLLVYMEVMKSGNCEIQMGKYYFGVLAEIIAFGGLGLFAYGFSDNLIIGYMAPLVYYAAAIGMGSRYLGKCYPFGMLTDYQTKYWILGVGVLLMAAGVWKRCQRSA